VRVLIFHGYLLRGTGSNVYNASLAQALASQGHEVHLLCQDRHADELDWVRASDRITVHIPDIGGLLPVYVLDRYEGFEVKTFPDLSDEELDNYIDSNVNAVRQVVEDFGEPDAALANHLIMGPVILARAGLRFAIKVHGSDISYTVRPHPDRFVPYAREGTDAAAGILAGSSHTARALFETVPDPTLPERTRLGPPGVDVHRFRPHPDDEALRDLEGLAAALGDEQPATGEEDSFGRDGPAIATALRAWAEGDQRALFVGKLLVSKGVDLLAAAWPLVLRDVPDAKLVVVGFGGWRAALERLLEALRAGDLDAVRAIAAEGRALEGGPRAPLRHLLAFLDSLNGADRAGYLAAAARLGDRVVLTGRLEHDELAPLLAACEAQVVPSTFPEAFGMVAAEAAACGALPVSAAHSGLAEVTATLAAAVPAPARPWLSFDVGDGAVRALAGRIVAWLRAPEALRAQTREALVAVARERYSWEGVAAGVLAAAEGRHDALPEPV
jgi:glycosyltransferase involved in cell wall biosynthesis